MHKDALEKSKDYVNNYHLSRTAIFNQVNASLKRLDIEYIDLLQIHRFDVSTPLEETMRALHDLVQQGKVRYIGASSMWATQFARMQFVAEKNGCKSATKLLLVLPPRLGKKPRTDICNHASP